MRGNHPSISWNDSTNGGGASMAATAKLAYDVSVRQIMQQKVRPCVATFAKRIPYRVCKHGAESRIIHQLTSKLTSTPLDGG